MATSAALILRQLGIVLAQIKFRPVYGNKYGADFASISTLNSA